MKLSRIPILVSLISTLLHLPTVVSAAEIESHKKWSYKEAGKIPVQSGGRIKPLDTYAREIMLYVTGSRFFEGWDPVELLLSWMVHPQEWQTYPLIQVGNADAKKQLVLDLKKSRFTMVELIEQSKLRDYASEINQKAPPAKTDMRADPREKEIRSVMERMGIFRNIVAGDAWPVIPAATAGGVWVSLTAPNPSGQEIREKFRDMVLAYRAGDEAKFDRASSESLAAVFKQVPGGSATLEKEIDAEFLYNRTHPFLLAWVFYLIAGLLWLVGRSLTQRMASIMTSLAVALHVGGIAIRCYIAGRPPVTNMYESIIWVSFGVVLFGFILRLLQKQTLPVMVACFLATLGLVAADAAPAMMDPGLHPLVPVLRSNYWLTIHVLTITISYAAFALAFGISNITLFQFMKGGAGVSAKTNNLNQLTYRVMQFGVVLVAAGTILGGVWADYSWGRFWGWDPKEVWALIVLLAYIVILHARFTGWVGQFGFAFWSVVCFLSVLMAWYGVNFVLGVGLHSYGFSTGGRGVVFSFVGAQLLYVGLVSLVYKSRASRTKAA